MDGLSDAKLDLDLRDAFEKYDIHHTGKVAYSDLISAITRYFNENNLRVPTYADHDKALRHFNLESSDSLGYTQFRQYVNVVMEQSN